MVPGQIHTKITYVQYFMTNCGWGEWDKGGASWNY